MPKFLTKEMAEVAVLVAIQTILYPPEVDQEGFGHKQLKKYLKPKRDQCHIIVLVPGMTDHVAEDYPNWPDYSLKPVLLFEHSFFGGTGEHEGPFEEIARCKALQRWTDRNDGRTDIIPHLLYQGDTPYWGSVKRDEIVVACSGVQPYIDRLISSMVADLLIAMAYEAWKVSTDRKEEVDFLT